MCGAIFDVAKDRARLVELDNLASEPEFWNDQERAQKVMKERKGLEVRVQAEGKLKRLGYDLETYLDLAKEETNAAQRQSMLAETARELDNAAKFISELETSTLLSGENDALNAILTVKSGAGGTESQDWTAMLLRMYLRWAERHGFVATVIDRKSVV